MIKKKLSEAERGQGMPVFSKGLEKGLHILGLFSPESPRLSLTEITVKAGLNPTPAYRFVETLIRLGYLDREAKTSEGAPVPAVSAALAAAGSRPLPLLCGMRDPDSVSWVAELPATAEDVVSLLKAKGLP